MDIKILQVSPIGTNCYIVSEGKEAFIIDPGGDSSDIVSKVGDLNVKYILLTHTHYDHIGAMNDLIKVFPEAKVGVHILEKDALYDPLKNLSCGFGIDFKYEGKVDAELNDGDTIDVGKLTVKVIHTPGHTVGGVCYLTENTLFSGDTLFLSSVGRTDLPGGDGVTLLSSIRNKLFSLPGGTKVYPGHMNPTTIAWEKQRNPYAKIN
jgi:hydroxyacylglutathione hydrolase